MKKRKQRFYRAVPPPATPLFFSDEYLEFKRVKEEFMLKLKERDGETQAPIIEPGQ